jgi:hypothetical protein
MCLQLFILPTKTTATRFKNKASKCYFGKKRYASVLFEFLPDASVQTMPIRFG